MSVRHLDHVLIVYSWMEHVWTTQSMTSRRPHPQTADLLNPCLCNLVRQSYQCHRFYSRLNDMQGMQALKSCSNNPYWFLWRHLYTPIWTCEKHWESYIPFYRPHMLKTVLPTNRPPGGYNHMHLIIMTRQFIRHRNTMTGLRASCKPMQQWKHKSTVRY